VPFTAGLPFFMVTDFGFFISLFVLHFTQYPVVISILRPYSLNYNYAIKDYIILIEKPRPLLGLTSAWDVNFITVNQQTFFQTHQNKVLEKKSICTFSYLHESIINFL